MTDDLNARDYLSGGSFIRKAELRTGGPRRLTIKSVESIPGLPKNGGKPQPVLCLTFQDDTRFPLGTQVNLKRVLNAYGDRTAGWIGKVLELYFSPDVSNPSNAGDPGGIRVRIPDNNTVTAPSPGVFTSELDDDQPVF